MRGNTRRLQSIKLVRKGDAIARSIHYEDRVDGRYPETSGAYFNDKKYLLICRPTTRGVTGK
jgi:hypothetical protein